jgi:hypothetical protein
MIAAAGGIRIVVDWDCLLLQNAHPWAGFNNSPSGRDFDAR